MKLRDVPLSFLPTFEAAGRLGSFAAAAAELHLTPSAISQQIRTLEDALGVPLFERSGRTAILTQAGEQYLSDLRVSLGEIAASTGRLQRHCQGSVLRLSTVALAAHEFLLPRLPAFQRSFPDLELRVESCNEYIDFRVTDYDAAIRVGEAWSDVVAHPLGRLEFAVVCSPQLAAEIHSVSDLRRYTLLDPSGTGPMVLETLQRKHGVAALGAPRTWAFESCFEALRAAEHGLGITFAAFPLTTPWVTSARLAVPLPDRIAIQGQAFFVHRAADTQRLPLTNVATWLAAEFQALPGLPPGRVTV
jgi:LysR family glycine cleavage system transcriptional activator